MTGPITIHQYMRAMLTHPKGGYYMTRDRMGQAGDFITSPEISQMFGELLGVWVYSEWHRMGRTAPLLLVELGPGRGTLMLDVLRSLGRLGVSGTALEVHLVEVSPHYRLLQQRALCPQPQDNNPSSEEFPSIGEEPPVYSPPSPFPSYTPSGSAVFWHETLDSVPSGFSMFLAHEFFDVLPIHKLVKTDDGEWREVLIDINGDVGYGGYGKAGESSHDVGDDSVESSNDVGNDSVESSNDVGNDSVESSNDVGNDIVESSSDVQSDISESSADVLDNNLKDSQGSLTGSKIKNENNESVESMKVNNEDKKSVDYNENNDDSVKGINVNEDDVNSSVAELPLRYILSRAATPASKLYAQDLDGRDTAEVCPDAALVVKAVAERITAKGGALLVVDYGHTGTRGDTFRAFRAHRQQHPLWAPGTADLTADVDFSLLKKALPETAMSVGPVSQATFLKNLGIELRLMKLLQGAKSVEEHRHLVSGYRRLVDDLGKSFSVFAVYPKVIEKILQRYPSPGFWRPIDQGWSLQESAKITEIKKKMLEAVDENQVEPKK
ncbi:protein arginine methyltransferase NDUFAF7, mitochondrial isoform X3 [Hyalella azteca]|nr:protein arginine methyltransferase NDUFAF7, mitochondrial isoform X2 [Hyalella azteca]XP_047736233.1 protein arginine methyltransferase NDUFAF7, mitochondrial isoform X3 [Hyalella azteca]